VSEYLATHNLIFLRFKARNEGTGVLVLVVGVVKRVGHVRLQLLPFHHILLIGTRQPRVHTPVDAYVALLHIPIESRDIEVAVTHEYKRLNAVDPSSPSECVSKGE